LSVQPSSVNANSGAVIVSEREAGMAMRATSISMKDKAMKKGSKKGKGGKGC